MFEGDLRGWIVAEVFSSPSQRNRGPQRLEQAERTAGGTRPPHLRGNSPGFVSCRQPGSSGWCACSFDYYEAGEATHMWSPLRRRMTPSSSSPWSETSRRFFSMMSAHKAFTRSAMASPPQTAANAVSSSVMVAACFGIERGWWGRGLQWAQMVRGRATECLPLLFFCFRGSETRERTGREGTACLHCPACDGKSSWHIFVPAISRSTPRSSHKSSSTAKRHTHTQHTDSIWMPTTTFATTRSRNKSGTLPRGCSGSLVSEDHRRLLSSCMLCSFWCLVACWLCLAPFRSPALQPAHHSEPAWRRPPLTRVPPAAHSPLGIPASQSSFSALAWLPCGCTARRPRSINGER
jgi:hypothetical protein